MPCGKKPLVKSWDRPRNLKTITPSRYEKNEASVKVHWANVIHALEMSYKDEQFWESNCDTVRELVGPVVFQRIAKIFNLPRETGHYLPKGSDVSTPIASEQFYQMFKGADEGQRQTYSMSDFTVSLEEEEVEEEEASELWSGSSVKQSSLKMSRIKSMGRSFNMSKMASKMTSKSFSKVYVSKILAKSTSHAKSLKSLKSEGVNTSLYESAFTSDDMEVNGSKFKKVYRNRRLKNPHFDMLYCNESETDMIKWNSKYKQKVFEVSASDEFSKKAEILTKQIAKDFYDWWVGLGNVEFKSEIKRPEDIETLFQIWFEEHASKGLMLHPKILPCVLKSIADYVGVPKTACPKVLKRQIAYDIHGETTPAHVMAFGTCLPQKMKHIPPNNNTQATWDCVKIPEDLRSMACVWEDISHLTSTKAFYKWLEQRPHLPMPPYLKALGASGDKKQLFVVPSDFVLKETKSVLPSADQELALPVSQFSLELKEVLSKILNQ